MMPEVSGRVSCGRAPGVPLLARIWRGAAGLVASLLATLGPAVAAGGLAGGLAILASRVSHACSYPGGPPGSEPVESAGPGIVWAAYANATDAYAHGVLGDAIEAEALRAMSRHAGPCDLAIYHEDGTVFEDTAPRIADVTGDGITDVVVVESRPGVGARLAVYALADPADETGQRLDLAGATPFIGTGYRWLAPAGIGDLDGDGRVEIAYVEMPHVGGTLRVWRFEDSGLVEVAAASGFSNHRIGEAFITGGLRDCGTGPELVLPDFGWRRIMAVRLEAGRLMAEVVGQDPERAGIDRLLRCEEK